MRKIENIMITFALLLIFNGFTVQASEADYQIVNVANVYAEIPAEWEMVDASEGYAIQKNYEGNNVHFYFVVFDYFDENLEYYNMESSVNNSITNTIEGLYDDYEIMSSEDFSSGENYTKWVTAESQEENNIQVISVYCAYSHINNTFYSIAMITGYPYESEQTSDFQKIMNHVIESLAIVYPYDDETFNEDYEALESEYDDLQEKYDELSSDYDDLMTAYEILQTYTQTEVETKTESDTEIDDDIILVDDDNVKITYMKIYAVESLDAIYIQCRVENKSDQTIVMTLDSCYVNDFNVQAFSGMSDSIEPGKKSQAPSFFFGSQIDVTSIEDANLLKAK